ncbi:MAG: 3-dehydroquinate synthase [Rhodobacterales bacterium 32-67-9]|nr:MAG: 3-dehydroquinate synthase [Rhodobacterales bacterium 32-67-9]
MTMQRKSDAEWTTLIDEICSGVWINPLTGKAFPPTAYDSIVFSESLEGREADLVQALGFTAPFAVVSDQNTHRALGERVARALSRLGPVSEIILDHPHADMASVRDLEARLKPFSGIVAVGSGTLNDLTKFATFRNGQKYCVFATAGSMNGYTSSTASITMDSGLKVSLPSQPPSGFFVDLQVSASAPAWLNAAGFGDCLCRSVAQIDWWMSHRTLGTTFRFEPFLIEIPDEVRLMEQARGIASGDINAVGSLYRVLTLCGLGVNVVGTSHHGSMGEHQISHYIDCFAGDRHPGTLHGQQVGVATLTMARVQGHFLSRDAAPEVSATRIDPADMARRMGSDIAAQCEVLYRKKAFDDAGADRFNARIAAIWPELREECQRFAVPVETLQRALAEAGGPTSAQSLGVPIEFYREAVCHAHEMRDRFSFADIACDGGILHDLAENEV